MLYAPGLHGHVLNSSSYYQRIHPVFPILPNSKERFLEILHRCGRELQEIFLYSLYTVTRANLERLSGSFERVTSYENAQDLLLYYTRQPAITRSTTVNLIWLQSILLMILDCDARGPDNMVMKDGVPKHTLIQSATKLGSDLVKGLHLWKSQRVTDPDVDSESSLARRSWVSLAIMARWYAISVADPSVLNTLDVRNRGDERILGSVTARVCCMYHTATFHHLITWTNHKPA